MGHIVMQGTDFWKPPYPAPLGCLDNDSADMGASLCQGEMVCLSSALKGGISLQQRDLWSFMGLKISVTGFPGQLQ